MFKRIEVTEQSFFENGNMLRTANMGNAAAALFYQMDRGLICTQVIVNNHTGNIEVIVYTVEKNKGNAPLFNLPVVIKTGCFLGYGGQHPIHARTQEGFYPFLFIG